MDYSREFRIDIETDKFAENNSTDDEPMVTTGIRIHANDICITSPSESYSVADYLPHNCVKWLNAIEAMMNGEVGLVSFSDTICEVYLHPISDKEVAITAERLDGSKINPDVPDEGIRVPQSSITNEVLDYSQTVRDRFEAIDSSTMESQTVSRLHALLESVPYDSNSSDKS